MLPLISDGDICAHGEWGACYALFIRKFAEVEVTNKKIIGAVTACEPVRSKNIAAHTHAKPHQLLYTFYWRITLDNCMQINCMQIMSNKQHLEAHAKDPHESINLDSSSTGGVRHPHKYLCSHHAVQHLITPGILNGSRVALSAAIPLISCTLLVPTHTNLVIL